MKRKKQKFLFTLLSILIITQIAFSGIIPHSHHEHHDPYGHHETHHTDQHADENDHADDADEHNCDDCNHCQCACLCNTVAIHELVVPQFFLSFLEKPVILKKIYKAEYFPCIDYPPLNS